jgi:5-hydroxyisourate hydrolase
MARLSTHVLDTALGVPAAGIDVELYALRGDERVYITSTVTNADGRTDAPLLAGDHIQPGVYELVFQAGPYFRRAGAAITNPPFLDEVVVRFGVADPAGHYHVPLLLSPHAYSTYRGT